jgi:ABC-2 type transport system permease protein
MSWLVAPANDVATTEWLTLSGLSSALGNYLTVLAGVAGWAVFGTTLAVIFRSAPLALGVGFAWAGPFENIVVDSWDAGYRLFPGQVLGSLIRGGTAELAMSRAVLTGLIYVGGAALVALTLVSRRDVTA